MASLNGAHTISELTRRQILDSVSGNWSGRLDDVDFLSRSYDLEAMPSFDSRYGTASEDIWKHRVINYDWDIDWVFNDKRFNILRGSDEAFLRFITETIHPVVRPDADGVEDLLATFNKHLAVDGWRLTEVSQISGRPVYGPVRVGDRRVVYDEPTGWPKVDRQLQQARQTLLQADSEEEYQSVGLMCREALISAAQTTYLRDKYPPLDGVGPSDADAGRMIEAIIGVELSGSANEQARGHAKAALKLAVALQHKRTADHRTAALCSEATFSVVNILAILMGRRGA